MKNVTLGCICAKCGGSGKIDWSNQDGGVCYKCEGVGYIGEMPEGFLRANKEAKDLARALVMSAHNSRRAKGTSICYPTYEFSYVTIDEMINKGISFKFKYSDFWMYMPDCSIRFGFDARDNFGYCYEIVVGGEFIAINPIKFELTA